MGNVAIYKSDRDRECMWMNWSPGSELDGREDTSAVISASHATKQINVSYKTD